MAHISGKAGHVYGGALLVEDCEDVWVQGTTDTTVSLEPGGKVGTSFVRGTTVAVGATTLLMYENFTAKDLTTYDGIYCWLRSSLTTTAGNLQVIIDETNGCAVRLEALNVPALTAATWKQVFARLANPSILNLVLSVGLYQVTDLENGTFDIDDVEALAELDGLKSWTLDYTADTLEATDFGSAGVKEYIIGGSGWSGSFEGFKDGVPLSIGSEVYLTLGESATASQNWIGKVIITGAHPNTSSDGIVTYSYDYQGTGSLEMPSA